MPIQILDNFEVNISKPIDNRFVVGSQSFYTNKEQIPYRYPGLRIWDLNDNFPYIWTGVTWSNENQSGSVIGSGIVNRLAKFTGINNIGSSIVFDNGINVGINIFAPTDRLHVDGNIRSTGNFIGNGSLLTSLNATNITSGSLSLTRITAGTSGQILVRGSSNAEFVNSNTITVGTSSVANNLVVNPASDNATYHVPFFSSTTGLPGNRQIFATSSSIQINPSTGNVGIGTFPSNTTNRLTIGGDLRLTGTTQIKADNTLRIITENNPNSIILQTKENYTETNAPNQFFRIIINGSRPNGILLYTPDAATNATLNEIGNIKIRPGNLSTGTQALESRPGYIILERRVQMLSEIFLTAEVPSPNPLVSATYNTTDLYMIRNNMSQVSVNSMNITTNFIHGFSRIDRLVTIQLGFTTDVNFNIFVWLQNGTDVVATTSVLHPDWVPINSTSHIRDGVVTFNVPAGCRFLVGFRVYGSSATSTLVLSKRTKNFGRNDGGIGGGTPN
jgi:hypothetical protein